MNPSEMPPAIFPSDEADGLALYVFPMGNGDWYAGVEKQRPDGSLPMMEKSVRFCTDATQMAPNGVLCAALLYQIGVGNDEEAERLAEAMLDRYRSKRPKQERYELLQSELSDHLGGRPDFGGFVESLRSESGWVSNLGSGTKDKGMYDSDSKKLNDLAAQVQELATAAETVGKDLGHL